MLPTFQFTTDRHEKDPPSWQKRKEVYHRKLINTIFSEQTQLFPESPLIQGDIFFFSSKTGENLIKDKQHSLGPALGIRKEGSQREILVVPVL